MLIPTEDVVQRRIALNRLAMILSRKEFEVILQYEKQLLATEKTRIDQLDVKPGAPGPPAFHYDKYEPILARLPTGKERSAPMKSVKVAATAVNRYLTDLGLPIVDFPEPIPEFLRRMREQFREAGEESELLPFVDPDDPEFTEFIRRMQEQ